MRRKRTGGINWLGLLLPERVASPWKVWYDSSGFEDLVYTYIK
ncbi:hypothetical protein KNP414_06857 [Paenibacillus mucilaginosus KNP414]|uniref:Uncharacterized protein n=1 Tax=Paenibacillus mucilaginosus (strain KNP414) TaxID=1036673 RepID=F8FEQ8_PAEMK|nr:hypothetical protein KNP414_06857 [Paenibacillus mucilaginosus KNP414]